MNTVFASTQLFMQLDTEYKHDAKRRARYELIYSLYSTEFANDQALWAQYQREISEQAFEMNNVDIVIDLDCSSMVSDCSSMGLDDDVSMYVDSLTSSLDSDMDYDELEKGTYYEYSNIDELATQLGYGTF